MKDKEFSDVTLPGSHDYHLHMMGNIWEGSDEGDVDLWAGS